MSKRIVALAAAALVAFAGLTTGARATSASRVIVTSTLNDMLLFFDASTLQEVQPPLPSKGAGPVRLALKRFGKREFLFSANHGVAGSVGVFDVTGPLVTELPLSPFATGSLGSVGIATGTVGSAPYVAVTNAYQALAGCGMPKGSVTVFDASRLDAAGVLVPGSTTELSGAQPFAVESDGSSRIYASANCSNTLDVLEVGSTEPVLSSQRVATLPTGSGPDGIAFDEEAREVYVTNIGSSSLSVFHQDGTPGTTVPVGGGPIEVVIARSLSGSTYAITANGRGDSISVVDRDVVRGCVAAAVPACSAEVARIPTGMPGGAPESVAYDPATNRVFVVNKTFPPSLSVIQLTESAGTVAGSAVARISLGALGSGTSVPAAIAFDVIVQAR